MSVASNLAALGALMKTNLEAKGVTGLTSDMGLTTLANKILEIPSGSSTSLLISGSRSIISSGETCSLSGLLKSNGQTVEDELIVFYNDDDTDPLAIGDSCDNFIFKADAEAGNGYIDLSTPQLYSLSIYWHESNRGNYFYMIYDANDQHDVGTSSPNLHGDILYRMGDTFITNGGDSFTLPSAYSSYFFVEEISHADEFHPIIGAGFTNFQGIVSVDYVGTGFGDVTVVAEATVNGTFLQETYEIEDCIKYIADATSCSSCDIDLPSRAIISFKMSKPVMTGNHGGVNMQLIDNSNHTYFVGNWSSLGDNGLLIRNTGSSSNLVDQRCSGISANTEYLLGIIYDNGDWTYFKDSEVKSFTANYVPTKINVIQIQQGYMKELKVKAL